MHKILPKHILFIFCIAFGSMTLSQEKTFKPEGSLSVDIGIPTKGKNYSFGRVMEGLFNGGIGYQYNIVGGLSLGVGAKYSFFKINSFALNNADWGGGLHFPAAYFKLGYERFTTERISFNASLRMGYTYMISANDSCKRVMGKPHTEEAFFLEPQIEIVLLTGKTEPDGFSLMLGYNFYFEEFGPRFLCMEKFPGLVEEDYKGITRFLSIGFGYRYYMGRK